MKRLSHLLLLTTAVICLPMVAYGQSNTIQLRNGSNSTTILPSASTTIAVQIPALSAGTHYLLTSTTNPGSSGASIDGLSDAKSGGTGFTSSLIIGHEATGSLSAGNPAFRNTALGISAMQAITTGDDNTSAGFEALANLTQGSGNTAVGSYSGNEITTGVSNVVIGNQAGFGIETGIGNIAVGAGGIFRNGSLQASDVGNYNIAVGFGAMYEGPSGSKNIGIGYAAGNNLLAGQYNTLIGSQAGYNLTTGSSNVFIGFEVGSNATIDTESNLLMIDNSSTLTPLIYGNFNTDALTFNGSTTTTGNVTVGGGASASEVRFLEPSGSGSNYSAFKAQAQGADVTYTLPAADGTNGYVLTTNGSGTLSWAAASGGATNIDGLSDAVSNSNVVALGSQAGTSLTTGGYAVFVGNLAGNAFAGNTNVVAVGYGAMRVATGGDNVAMGTESLNGLTSGTNNVAIGTYAGATNVTTGSGNVFIGDRVYPSTNVSNQLFIDNSTTDSPLIKGDFSANTLTFNGSTTTTGSARVGQLKRHYRNDVTGGTHNVQDTDCWIVVNGGGTTTITMPDPTIAANLYRELMFKTIQAQLVEAASSHVVQLNGNATSTAILPAVDGAWATLVCDGTNWVIMQQGQ